MGKTFRKTANPYVLDDETLDKVIGQLPKETGSKTANNNPYVLDDHTLSTIPEKKNGGSEISSPTQLQSGSEENPQTFLENDIDNTDFFSELYKSTDPFSQEKIPSSDEQTTAKRQLKKSVFTDPTSLTQYTKDRINQLNKKVKDIQGERNKLVYLGAPGEGEVFGALADVQTITDKKRYDQLTAEINNTQDYIRRLKNNVADVATDFVMKGADAKTFNPKQKGREIIQISDPELDEQFQLVQKSGMTLPGIRDGEMERLGLNAAKNYVIKNPELPNRAELVNLINDYESDFDERNFELTGQRVREKLGAELYKQGKSGFWGYSQNDLDAAVKNTDLSPGEQKVYQSFVKPLEKKILGTDIPGSGFFRSFRNAIEKSSVGAGKTLGDITGLREEGEVAQDFLNQEIDQSRFRTPGESPTGMAQLLFLRNKEKTDQLTKEEQQEKLSLEKYVDVRNRWSRFKDGVGDLTGQVVQIALLTKGMSGVGGALVKSGASGGLLGGLTRSTIGQALSNETVGLFINSYLNSYDNYLQQSIAVIPGKAKSAERDAYAKTMAAVEGLSERLFNDTKILNAFTKGVAPSVRDIASKFINKEITQSVAREELQGAITKYLKPFGKEYLKSTAQESTEEAVVDVAQGMANSIFGGQDFDLVKTGQQAINTFLTTALYSPLVSGMAAHGSFRQNQSQNAFLKSAIVNMGANPAEYLKAVEDLQLNGTITQQEANEKIKLIKSANKYLQEIPASRPVAEKIGEGEDTKAVQQDEPIDYPQTASYLLHRMNEGIIEEKINGTTDEIVISQLNKELKRSQEIRKGIYNGKIGVTDNLQDVTDNDKDAEELGISDSNEMSASQLVGTPFQNKQDEDQQTTEIDPEVEQKPPSAAEILKDVDSTTKEFEKLPEEDWKEVATLTNSSTKEEAAKIYQDAKVTNTNPELVKTVEDIILNKTITSQQKINENENQIVEETAAQESGEEINAEEGISETTGSKEVDVLEKEGAEPSGEAPLELSEVDIQKPLEPTLAKRVSTSLRDFATKIKKVDITGSGGESAQSDITRIPREIIAFSINTVADAIDAGESIANAIQKGIEYLKGQGQEITDDSYKSYVTDVISGKKPKVRVQVGGEKTEQSKEKKKAKSTAKEEDATEESIEDYKMTTSDKVGKFLSGDTWEDVFGENPEGDQSYLVQGLSDMLQDGKNMIAIAQQKWGGDVMMYAKPLFQLIQNMSNDNALTNKKAVLMATLLGELQEAKLRSPERLDAINQLEKVVFAYYQNYMNVRGKEIVAGRLLRLYRDKYIADVFSDQILEKNQVKAKKAIQDVEKNKKIDDSVASEEKKTLTKEEKSREDNEAKKTTKKAKKEQEKKKKLSSNEAKKKAEGKLNDIEARLGKDSQKGLLARIKEAINKLNCK